ncbi:MAG: type II secretion system F family protein, partial [Caloramator sp.]|nr:type II secretion system F family protein [Caloramator sp.]
LMENIESKSFLERAIYPLYNFLINFFVRFTPKNKIKNLTAKLERAGYSKNLEKWIFTKSVSMIIVFLSSYMLFDFISQNTLKSMLLSIILVMLTSYMFNFNLARRIEIRKRNILKNLPYTLDLITVSVEAGLSFDGAIAKVIENIQGDLSDEFAKTLKEMKMGIPRKIALKNLSERCGVRELSMLVTSLIQADELGVSLG